MSNEGRERTYALSQQGEREEMREKREGGTVGVSEGGKEPIH